MIRVIEQWFDGIRFRSKTEARWAVFFKACRIRYEYEKEGYDLGGGLYYLPDFWLPDLHLWFEVKGTEPSQDELETCYNLAGETRRTVLLAVGAPDQDVEQITRINPSDWWVDADKDWRIYREKNWRASEPANEWEYGWQFADDRLQEGIFWLDSSEFGAFCIGPNKERSTDYPPTVGHSATARGFNAVRRKRFVNYGTEANLAR